METTTDKVIDMTDLKDSLQALKEVKTLLPEFPILLEAARLCRQAKSRQEKVLTRYQASTTQFVTFVRRRDLSSGMDQSHNQVQLHIIWPIVLIIRLEDGGPFLAVRFVKPLIPVCGVIFAKEYDSSAGGIRSMWMRCRRISTGGTIMVGSSYLPPVIVRISNGRVGSWPVMATRIPASVLELIPRLSFNSPWMP
ncbi:hypothetical protein AVEN_167436-1 [Araneus ventricosus]|uniref:Uncharacterized protein n=1 Tax=Araneus ventricosus TaxID=182803 RepID=A0A4Y2EP63_ARAVE|nr:hypothetical protein AVEN_167436-1 [Araneus ventricosus]